ACWPRRGRRTRHRRRGSRGTAPGSGPRTWAWMAACSARPFQVVSFHTGISRILYTRLPDRPCEIGAKGGRVSNAPILFGTLKTRPTTGSTEKPAVQRLVRGGDPVPRPVLAHAVAHDLPPGVGLSASDVQGAVDGLAESAGVVGQEAEA